MCAFSTYPDNVFRGAFCWSVRNGFSGPWTGANSSSYRGLYVSSFDVGSITRATSLDPCQINTKQSQWGYVTRCSFRLQQSSASLSSFSFARTYHGHDIWSGHHRKGFRHGCAGVDWFQMGKLITTIWIRVWVTAIILQALHGFWHYFMQFSTQLKQTSCCLSKLQSSKF